MVRNWLACLGVMLATLFFTGGEVLAASSGLAARALDLSDQFIFTPNELSLDFFALDTQLPWSWVEGSFEWVRVDRKMLVPKARARIEVPAGTVLRYHDHVFRSDRTFIEVPVVLTQEVGNQIEVGTHNPSRIRVLFKSVRKIEQSLILDTSCSQIPLRFQNVEFNHSWGYLYCRTVHPKVGSGYSLRVDIELRWEAEGNAETFHLNGVPVESEDGVTHEVSFAQGSDSHHFSKGKDSFDLSIPVPERFHPFWFSMGIGPYSHQNVVRPFPTFYAGYYFNDGMRLASFTALPIRKNPEIDTGLYLVSEQFKGIDERIHFSLLLGAHLLSFYSEGVHYSKMSAPQGVELGFRDFLMKGENLTVGGFFYPMIANRFYINSWIRFGSGRLFYEFNFINWQEPVDSGNFSAKSAGVSIGFPLFRAL